MTAAPTICLNCREPIRKGRSDKKFCDSACKDEYYNAIKTDENNEIRKVGLILKKNRRILKTVFNPKKEDLLIKRETLLKAGFEFDYHTHYITTKFKGNEYIFCFDFGYREVDPDKFKVIKSFK